jgi:two-component system sensor histidine kinase YesM
MNMRLRRCSAKKRCSAFFAFTNTKLASYTKCKRVRDVKGRGHLEYFSKVKAFYPNLRIKHKMFVLITSVMLLVCLCSMAVFQYVFDVYDREIYAQASQSLNVSSFGVENELRKMAKLSFRVATDPEIQRYLLNEKLETTHYAQFVTATELRNRLLELGGFEKYVLSMQVHDSNNFEYRNGNQAITTPEQRVRTIAKLTAEELGGNRWIYPDRDDNTLAAAREIRSYRNLEFDRLGMLSIRIDLKSISSDYARGMDEDGAHFLIMSGQELIIPDGLPFAYHTIGHELKKRNGYKIMELGGKRYFMTYAKSSYIPWTYIVLMPYDQLFRTILTVKNIVVVIFASLFLLAIVISVRFSKDITRPIESLNAKMKSVQKGNFTYVEEPGDRQFPMDETGHMHRNFRMMIERIDELINENFKKQLAIKESEFKALQSQINPHFLYNTLESINWSAKLSGMHDISTMVGSLGALLRSTISHKNPLVTIKEEMEMVGHYIAIQKVRYEERLDFEADIPAAAEGCIIPKLTLQPLVENAIHYGVERMIEPCRIRIRAAVVGRQLELTVEDNGPGMDKQSLELWQKGELQTRGAGIGLRNIHERLRLMFGEGSGLNLTSEQFVGTRVTVSLPLERKDEERV